MQKIRFNTVADLINKKKKLCEYYKLAIFKYHSQFRLPLKGRMWEEVLENILEKAGFKILTPVDLSAKRGRDIEVSQFNWVSCKSCKIVWKKRLGVQSCSISGYRLSKVEDFLESILIFDKSFDFYIISMYSLIDGHYTYELFVMPVKILVNSNFRFDGNKTNIHNCTQLRVEKALASQLWIDIYDLSVYRQFRVIKVTVQRPNKINLL